MESARSRENGFDFTDDLELTTEPESSVAVSLPQLQMWCRARAESSSAEHVGIEVHLRGELQVRVLRLALNRLVDCYEVLRAHFAEVNGEVRLVAAPSRDGFLLIEEPVTAAATAQEIIRYEVNRPFDLSAGPLIRGRLLRLAADEHLFLVTAHRSICGSRSLRALLHEIRVGYGGGLRAEPTPQPLHKPQHEALVEQRTFWCETLQGVPELLELPTDRTRSASRAHAVGQVSLELGAELTERVRALARTHEVSLFEAALAGWATLLSRWSGQEDVVIGTSVSGAFENPVALRLRIHGDTTVESLLHEVRTVVRQARENADLSFEEVVTSVGARSRSHHPIFQVFFGLESTPDSSVPWAPQLNGTVSPISYVDTRLDLAASFLETGGRLLGKLQFARELFDRETIERIATSFQVLLEAMTVDAQCPLGRLPVLSPPELEQVLHQFNDTRQLDAQCHASSNAERLIHELFERQVDRLPLAIAVIDEDSSLTYTALDAKANQLARYLRSRGVGADKLVALHLVRSVDMLVGILGVLKAGGAYVPLDPTNPADRLSHLLSDADPAVVLTQERFKDFLPSTSATIVALDAQWGEIEPQSAARLDARTPGLSASNLAYVIYTSGSTGTPKGVMVEHRNVVNYALHIAQQFDVSSGEGSLICTSMSFDLMVTGLYPTLFSGKTVRLCPEQQGIPALAEEILSCRNLAPLKLTPSHLALLEQPLKSGQLADRIRVLVLGGEPLQANAVHLWRRHAPTTRLFNHYGPTETTVGCLVNEVKGLTSGIVPIGRPIANVRVYVLDPLLQPVPIGVTGEIHIGGAGVARGYLNRPHLTAERFVSDPFSRDPQARLYKSGDLGRWRSDGTVEYLGRNDQQVKVRGYRVELGEIEAELIRGGEWREAAMIARDDGSGQKRLVAYVVPVPAAETGDTEFVREWQTIYDTAYEEPSVATGPRFANWASSYTGLPIPTAEMNEWLDCTVARILGLRPQRVLEIGCGLGMILERVAPHCAEYWGTDFSAAAIADLRRWLDSQSGLHHVAVSTAVADDLREVPLRSLDTVILNSVVQYFPDGSYLLAVIEAALARLIPGGRLFIGDVRNLDLLELFHSSVQLEKAEASASVEQVRARARRSIKQEKELVVSPELFRLLPARIPCISAIEIHLKRGRYENELSRYRYDVVLHVGSGPQSTALESWTSIEYDGPHRIVRIERTLETGCQEVLRLTRIPNGRLVEEIQRQQRLHATEPSNSASAIDPEDLWSLGERLGYNVRISWTRDCAEGHYDALFISKALNAPPLLANGYETAVAPEDISWDQYVNNPAAAVLQERLVARSRERLKGRLPEYMLPSLFVVLDSLPLTPNGKLDRRALPTADLLEYSRRPYESPRGAAESALASIWQDLLGIDRIGRQDNFYELGGHSLLAVQVIERLRQMNLSVDVRTVFESATLADLAAQVRNQDDSSLAGVPDLLPPGTESITPQMLPLVALKQDEIDALVQRLPGGARNVQDIYPLAPLQEGILFHTLLNEQSAGTYVLPTVLAVDSRQKLDQLIEAFQFVIARHDILRTAIFWEGLPQPVQVVSRQALLTVEELHLDANRDTLEQLMERTAPGEIAVDLHVAPLIRLQIAHEPKGHRWYALLLLSHLVGDHVSTEAVFSEVVEYLSGRAALLSKPHPYHAHVAQALALAQAKATEAESYFRRKLAGIDEPTAPFGALDVYGSGSRLTEVTEILELGLAEQIRAQARHLKVSPATLFHAAWALVVSRTSGRDDVVFGSVLLGRLQGSAGAQRTLGMFINTLPICLRLQTLTVVDLVDQTQQELLGLLPYEQVSLATVQRYSDIKGSAPLFTSLLNCLHSAPTLIPERDRAELGIEVLARREWTNYPITLSVADLGDGFSLTAQTELGIDPRRITAYLRTAVASLVEALDRAPHSAALTLAVLPSSEQHELLELFNSTQAHYPREKLIHELFEEQVQRTPSAIAAMYEQSTLTYAELNAKANQLARYLRKRGAGPDERVAICLERSLELPIGLLGILKAGAAYVPLDPGYPVERLAYMLRDSSPKVLLIQERQRQRLTGSIADIIAIDKDWDEIEREADHNLPAQSIGLTSHHLAYVIYTSGSTGAPKGAMNEHRALINRLQWMQSEYQLTEQDRVLQKTPFSFDVSVWEFFWTLMSGACLVVARPQGHQDPSYLMQLIEQTRVSVLHFVPSMLQVFLEHLQGDRCESMRHVICSGEQLSAALQRSFFAHLPRVKLSNLYGPTEAAIDVTSWECLPEDRSLSVPIGRPIWNTRMYVLDGHGQPTPLGAIGEIYIGGEGVARGYLNRPELTQQRFVADPFSSDPRVRLYKTGDLGRWRADGALEYVGRNDHQVKIRGFRIELGEIEAQLAQHAWISEAAVLAREDRPGEQRLVAYIVFEKAVGSHAPPSPDLLREHLRTCLPEYMVPGAIVVLDHMPLSPNGKLDRRSLPVPDSLAYSTREYEAPRGEVEELLAQKWRELLPVKRVGRHDNFFDLGGHSLLAMRVVVSMQAALAITLPMATLFDFPTLEALAQRIEQFRQAQLIEKIRMGDAELDELLEKIVAMPDSAAKEMMRELTGGGLQ